ncbi:hypothetical protein [Micromonospora okii]|uniref:hypothetical protein n=1 Tax=Micromonospora okii TaxID=1182970 RepID=UPI001E5D0278|nr:hypothetical protein [Micromonospora okii]
MTQNAAGGSVRRLGDLRHGEPTGGFAGNPAALLGANGTLVLYVVGTDGNHLLGCGTEGRIHRTDQPSPGTGLTPWTEIP